ncbi:hypothetical protein J4714_13970 [Staphylococcus epidermidis]|nr:hypothetical protein [Staphylococcus epidermidis]
MKSWLERRWCCALCHAIDSSLAASRAASSHAELDAQRFDHWLAAQGLDDECLLWYLDYSCRDDFGAGLGRVSAWAGIHYFASRHGFHAPRLQLEHDSADEGEQVLTWPQGNGWLSQQLVARLEATHLQTDCSVLAITEDAGGVQVDTWHHGRQQLERWLAGHCVVALPTVAARGAQRPDFLRMVATRLDWAPGWWPIFILISRWRTILVQSPLGTMCCIAMAMSVAWAMWMRNQRLDRVSRQPTVLSYYQALGDWGDGRRYLLEQPFAFWRDRIVKTLSEPHPDLLRRATRMEISRYGHAMAIPRPGDQKVLSEIGLKFNQVKRKQLSNGSVSVHCLRRQQRV